MNLTRYCITTLIIICLLTPQTSAAPYFTENKGQFGDKCSFLYKSSNMNAWICNGSIVFENFLAFDKNYDGDGRVLSFKEKGHIYRMKFEDADFSDFVVKTNRFPYFNYFLGKDSSEWFTKVKTLSEVLYKNIYNNIDLRLYFDKNNLRYDFIVHPQGDISDIKINFDFLDSIVLNSNNELCLHTSLGEIKHKNLFACQFENNIKKEIKCSFVLNADNSLRFKADKFDRSRKLIIDPLIFSTYLGGKSYDYSEGLALDSLENPIICGYTSSEKFPVTEGAYDTVFKVNQNFYPDAYVSKFSKDGKQLLFSTFIGGSQDDYGKDIAIDKQDNIYLTGFTYVSSSFPVKNGWDMIHNGKYDSFITKLSSDGSNLIYSTYIGGSKDDYATAIHISDDYKAHITGYTTFSGDYPVTANAFQPSHRGKYDTFIGVLSPSGANLFYSTLLGGSSDDFSQDIHVSPDGKIYITGITHSVNFPILGSAFQTSLKDETADNSGSDAFVTAIYPGDSRLALSTYLGGDYEDASYSVCLDDVQNIIISGQTASENFPVTQNVFDTSYNKSDPDFGRGDIFLTKFNPQAENLIFSTYIGGTSSERAYEVKWKNSLLYLTGVTSSRDFPVTKGAFDETFNDTNFRSDAFALKITDDGKDLKYCTYIGGKKNDVARKISQTKNDYSFISGTTSSFDFPVKDISYDITPNDSCCSDAFLLKILLESFYVDAGGDENGIAELCKGDSVQIGSANTGAKGSATFSWQPQNGLSDPSSPVPMASPEATTSYTFTVRDEAGNFGRDTVLIIVRPIPDAQIIGPRKVSPNSSASYSSVEKNADSYEWKVINGTIIEGAGTEKILVQWGSLPSGTLSLRVCNDFGCCSETGGSGGNGTGIVISVGDTNRPEIQIVTGALVFCIGDSVILDAGAGYSSYLWFDGSNTRYDTIKTTSDVWVMGVKDGEPKYSDTIRTEAQEYPPKPDIIFYEEDYTIESTVEAYRYLWYVNNDSIPNSNMRRFKPKITGKYKVEVFTEAGCSNISGLIYVVVDDAVHDKNFERGIIVFPNPSREFLNIEIQNTFFKPLQISIFNYIGEKIYNSSISESSEIIKLKIDMTGCPQGIYFLKAVSGSSFGIKRIILLN